MHGVDSAGMYCLTGTITKVTYDVNVRYVHILAPGSVREANC